MLISLATGQRLDTDLETKNNLPIGTIIRQIGRWPAEYVVIENKGIGDRFKCYGARYITVDVETYEQRHFDAFTLTHISQQHINQAKTLFFTNEIHSNTKTLSKLSYEKLKRKQEAQELEQKRITAKIEKGRQLFAKHIPDTAQALIIAEYEIDDCDTMTDYFAVKRGDTIILGYSNHNRDLFSEIRKHAKKLKQTAHLAVPNKENEHREKYSMGKGYYLKKSHCYDTGWMIYKRKKYGRGWDDSVYIAMAENCIFEK